VQPLQLNTDDNQGSTLEAPTNKTNDSCHDEYHEACIWMQLSQFGIRHHTTLAQILFGCSGRLLARLLCLTSSLGEPVVSRGTPRPASTLLPMRLASDGQL